MSSNILQSIIAAMPADFADPQADYKDVRAMFAPFHGHPVSDELKIDIVQYGGVRCGHYRLSNTSHEVTAFHCHGGAFVSTPLDEYHFYAQIIAQQTHCNVVMPDYRLAPEHTYPSAHDDCYDAYCGLLESGVDPDKIVIFGESCGGSLAIGVMLRLRDAGLPQPAAFVSLTGWFDLSVAAQGAHGDDAVAGRDPFLTPAWVRNRANDYLAGAVAPNDPAVSPAYAELAGLAPMYLQIGQFDTVREGALKLANNALRAGVNVTMEGWPDAIQGWHGLITAQVPEAIAAWHAIAHYVATHTAPTNEAPQ